MTSKVSLPLIVVHAFSTLAVIVTCLPLAFGVIAERAAGVDLFDPARGGDPAILAWIDQPWSRAALLVSFLLGLAQIALLTRDLESKRVHLYHAVISVVLCVCAFALQRTPRVWMAAPTVLLALLYLGFWSRRLLDPASR